MGLDYSIQMEFYVILEAWCQVFVECLNYAVGAYSNILLDKKTKSKMLEDVLRWFDRAVCRLFGVLPHDNCILDVVNSVCKSVHQYSVVDNGRYCKLACSWT